MADIDDKESELLAQVVAAGVVRLRGDQSLAACRLARKGLLRTIAARRRHAPPYFVASGAGIAALNTWNRARDLRQGCPERRGAPTAELRPAPRLELDQCGVGTRAAIWHDGAHADP